MFVMILNWMTFANLTLYKRKRFQNLKHFLMEMRAIDSIAGDSNEAWKEELTRQTVHGLQSNLKTSVCIN